MAVGPEENEKNDVPRLESGGGKLPSSAHDTLSQTHPVELQSLRAPFSVFLGGSEFERLPSLSEPTSARLQRIPSSGGGKSRKSSRLPPHAPKQNTPTDSMAPTLIQPGGRIQIFRTKSLDFETGVGCRDPVRGGGSGSAEGKDGADGEFRRAASGFQRVPSWTSLFGGSNASQV